MGLPDVLKIAFVLGFFVFGLTPLMVIVERRLSAFMQGRVGPDRVDFPLLNRLGGLLPGGLAQPLADAIKFIFKEDIIPDEADKLIYILAPLMVLVPPALGLIVIPFGSESLKLTLVNAVVVFGLVNVNVSDVVPPLGIDVTPNAFWIVGAPRIVTVAVLLASPGPLSFDVIGPVVLFFTPGVVPITLTAI